MNTKEIKIGEGLGDIKFGMSREQVRAALGEPDDMDQFDDSELDDDASESWHYDELELSLSFDEDSDWKLVTVAVSSPDYTFHNKNLIGLSAEALMAELEPLQLGEYETDDWSSEEIPDHKLISFPDAQLNFWLENGELTEIQWGPLFDGDDEIRPRREVAVDRPDPDTRPGGNLPNRRVDARGHEHLGGGIEQCLPVAHRVSSLAAGRLPLGLACRGHHALLPVAVDETEHGSVYLKRNCAPFLG